MGSDLRWSGPLKRPPAVAAACVARGLGVEHLLCEGYLDSDLAMGSSGGDTRGFRRRQPIAVVVLWGLSGRLRAAPDP